jgi:hypothetical protein
MPYGFDFNNDSASIPKLVNDPRFKFLFINQWSNRKYAKETVEAFCKTFRGTDDVVLYIRTFVLGGLGLSPLDMLKILKKLRHCIQIVRR